MEYLYGLNKSQLEAIEYTEGPLRVIAGAGSGKTKVLTMRYVYLIKELGILPKNILAVTFTNKAAQEMKSRVKKILGEDFDSTMISTYHSFCARLLREESYRIFYPKSFMIIDEAAQKDILAVIYEKYELKLDTASFEYITTCIGSYKETHDYILPLISNRIKIEENDPLELKLIKEYMIKEHELFGLDFDDLILFSIYVLKNYKDTREYYQDKLQYIEVDEFQDTDMDEYRLIDILSAKHKNLMVVGDPDQNIYEWRGSRNDILLDFDKLHDGCKTVILDKNYRSTKEILKTANLLIDHNKKRIKKDLYTDNIDGAKVTYEHADSEYIEAVHVVEKIKEKYNNTTLKYRDFAILYRSQYLSEPVERVLNDNFLPYRIIGGVKFYDRMEILDTINYLKLVAYFDDFAFKRIINKPKRKFGKVKLNKLCSIIGDEKLFFKLKDNIDSKDFKGNDVKGFLELIESLHDKMDTSTAYEITNELLIRSGYEKYIEELGDLERLGNLSAFKRIVFDYCNDNSEASTLIEFLEHIALNYPENKRDADEINLMTVHSAKGLEFKEVFLIGLTESIFPSAKTIEERQEDGLEEERRLLYVAITRAMSELYIYEPDGRIFMSGEQKKPSRFIREIGLSNLNVIGLGKDMIIEENERKTVAPGGGTRVNHKVFGDGTIISEIGDTCIVKFDRFDTERSVKRNFLTFKDDEVLKAEN